AALIVAGDFNHVELKAVLPRLHEFLEFPTREHSTLDQVYCSILEHTKLQQLLTLEDRSHLFGPDPCLQPSDLQNQTLHLNH
ncbi:hypothetical protein XENOCAPTIV_014403, partial [Xenoophorus captivus]